jgi:Family of unknown function (DUF6625)
MEQLRIVKVIPFYGSWPVFMHPYLESCRRNPMLQVTFVTDLGPFPGSPQNVEYYPLTFGQLRERIERLFGIDVSSIRPYKLCDFRPAYGVIFSDLVADADFWAHGDNDMILGDLRAFITPELLAAHDVLSFKKGHLQGPLTIYRNVPMVNNLFREGGEFKRVFASPAYLSFDEFGPGVFYTKVHKPEDVAAFPSDNISVIAFKKALAGELRVYSEQLGKEDLRHRETVSYQDGRIVELRSGREYLFYHWVLEKRGIWFRYPQWFSRRPARFYVSTTGFYSVAQFRAYAVLHPARLVAGAVRWATLKLLNYLRRRLGRPVVIDTYPRIGWVKDLRSTL